MILLPIFLLISLPSFSSECKSVFDLVDDDPDKIEFERKMRADELRRTLVKHFESFLKTYSFSSRGYTIDLFYNKMLKKEGMSYKAIANKWGVMLSAVRLREQDLLKKFRETGN